MLNQMQTHLSEFAFWFNDYTYVLTPKLYITAFTNIITPKKNHLLQ